jgi:hypothetical protein
MTKYTKFDRQLTAICVHNGDILCALRRLLGSVSCNRSWHRPELSLPRLLVDDVVKLDVTRQRMGSRSRCDHRQRPVMRHRDVRVLDRTNSNTTAAANDVRTLHRRMVMMVMMRRLLLLLLQHGFESPVGQRRSHVQSFVGRRYGVRPSRIENHLQMRR